MNWLDHIGAVLVGGAAILILAGLLALRSNNAVRETSLFSAQVVQRTFTDQLQIDLDNLGVGRPGGAPAVVAKTDDRFAFYTLLDTLGTGGLVEYALVQEGGEQRIRRTVDGREVGGTSDVTRFEVELLDVRGQVVADVEDAARIRVDVRKRAPFQGEATSTTRTPGDPATDGFETVGWTTEVRPFALRYTY